MQRQAKSIAEKMKAIQAIINGSVDFESLKPPQHYIAFCENDLCDIRGLNMPSIIMSRKEFEQWKETTIREIDTLVIFDHQSASIDNEPLLTHSELEMQYEASKPYRTNVTTEQKEAIEPPLNEPVIDLIDKQENKRKKKKTKPEKSNMETTELFAIPVKRSGRLSELGDTWHLTGWN